MIHVGGATGSVILHYLFPPRHVRDYRLASSPASIPRERPPCAAMQRPPYRNPHAWPMLNRPCLRPRGSLFPRFRDNPSNWRTMVAVGAGAGVAAAFKAPFAGVFFVVEELACGMSVRLVTASLLANGMALFVVSWLGQEATAELGTSKVEFSIDWSAAIGASPAARTLMSALAMRSAETGSGWWRSAQPAVSLT